MKFKKTHSPNRGKRIFHVVIVIILIIEIVGFICLGCWGNSLDDKKWDNELQITKAVLDFSGEEKNGVIHADIKNISTKISRYLPNIHVSEEDNAESYYKSLVPVLYYADLNASGVQNYDYQICIPPGQTVKVDYMLTNQDKIEIQAMQQNCEKESLYVTVYSLRQKLTYIPLEIKE